MVKIFLEDAFLFPGVHYHLYPSIIYFLLGWIYFARSNWGSMDIKSSGKKKDTSNILRVNLRGKVECFEFTDPKNKTLHLERCPKIGYSQSCCHAAGSKGLYDSFVGAVR